MSVTEVLRGLGQWSVQLDSRMNDDDWKKIAGSYFGHVCIHVGRPDPRVSGDSLLKTSRFTGVYVGTEDAQAVRVLDGFGMAFWLGDADNKGAVRESLLTFPPGTSFQDAITQLLPVSGSVVAGTIVNIPETWSGTHQYQTSLQDIDYVCQTVGAAWRVNGDATLDAGYEADLFVTVPKTVVTRKVVNDLGEQAAYDMFLRGLGGDSQTSRDVEDFTTRVLLLAQSAEGSTSTATADILPGLNPYKDLHGNDVAITRIIQESDTDPTNAPARAQLQLNRFTGTRDALQLSTANYDIKGHLAVGDYLWVCDPLMDLIDVSNEIPWRGKLINPLKLQLTETTWPIVKGHSVLFRTYDGEWIDLTDWVVWETGDTSIVVGGYNRSLTSGGGGVFPVTPPDVNTTVPNAPTWVEPFLNGVYQSPGTGDTRAEVILSWDRPTNTDSSVITDGDHFEIRYRQSTVPIFPVVWDQVETLYQVWDNWEDSGATWDYPIVYDTSAEWQTAVAPWDVQTFRLQELLPSMPYEAQIRAVDNGRPANISGWSTLAVFQTTADNLPPATPAAPVVAARPLAVLMTHSLGRADGGTFNLDRDLHHLELHGGPDALFSPDNTTLIGKVLANYGMVIGQIPVVANFQIISFNPLFFKVIAVDEAGNKSLASPAAVQTADLIESQYIESLTASKITAGTLDASVIVGGRIATMPDFAFPGVELTSQGIEGWNTVGFRSLFWDSTTGRLHVNGDGGIEIKDGNLTVKNAAGTTIVEVGECLDGRHGIQVYKDNGTRVARMGELASGAEGIEVINDLGQLVRVDTLAFGVKAASVSTKESSAAGSYANLTTVGPFVTVTIGNSGRCVVLLSGGIEGGTGGVVNASIGFDMAGPAGYFRAANVFESQWIAMVSAAGNFNADVSLTKAIFVSGLPQAGDYTVQMKYWTNGSNHSFFDRHLIVIPF